MTLSLRDTIFLVCGALIGVLALGRAWAQDTNQQIVTSAAARQPTAVPVPGARYQYMCQTKWPERIYDGEVQRRLNELGGQGWHLMPPMIARSPGMAYSDVYCFERAY
jgi:hypothetical protein